MLAEKFYRRLGQTGVWVSPTGLGTDNFANPTPEPESIEIINCAIEHGINLINTANSYSSGQSGRDHWPLFKIQWLRDDICQRPRFTIPSARKESTTAAIPASISFALRGFAPTVANRLHRPLPNTSPLCMETPLEETLAHCLICNARERSAMLARRHLRRGKSRNRRCWPNSKT